MYIPLGSRGPITAALDTTGLNPGNFTNLFDDNTLNAKLPYYEIYSITVTSLKVVATVTVYVNGQVRTTAKLLGNAEWDPNQAILMRDGDDLAIGWDFSTGTKPQVTVWLRYDPAVQPRPR